MPPAAAMSGVRSPSASARRTADSMAAASASSLNDRRSIIATLRIIAIGFAFPWPAMSGAEPWIGSYMPKPSALRLAEPSMPSEPASTLASSLRMSPKMLFVSSTSNWRGLTTICIDALSTCR